MTKPWDQVVGARSHLAREQLEHAACHPDGEDNDSRLGDLQELPRHHCSVTRLPPEILAYIFELHVVRSRDAREQGLISLTQVCSLWKEVAESDPLLWTSIHFYFPESHQDRKEDVPSVKSVLDLHLKRSGALPISLVFTDHRIFHSDTEFLVAFLASRLQTHSRRWKRISLQLAGGYFPLLFKFTPCKLSSLEHLYINCDRTDTDTRPLFVRTGLSLNLKFATNLKSFTYNGPVYSVDRLRIRWEGLAQISFEFSPHCGDNFTLSRKFRYLDQCQNITTCSLGIDRNERLSGTPPIALSRLQTLRVRRLTPHADARFAIDRLILPELQTLEIDASILVCWNERWHDHNFSALLARSGCTLLHLSIEDVDFPNDELVRCLALSPSLMSLRFIPCPRSQDISDVVRKLVASASTDSLSQGEGYGDGHGANASPLVPQLREITLASSVAGHLDAMLAIFRSRVGRSADAAGVAVLRRAEVVFFDLWHDTGVGLARRQEDRLGRITKFRAELAEWMYRNRRGDKGKNRLEASVVVDSPYLPEYTEVW